MSKKQEWQADHVSAFDVLGLLEGTWRGEGRGGFPTIASFDYIETLNFECRDENSLFYVQRTEKRMEGQEESVPSHWESGFIRVLEENKLELANVQIGGRSEILVGTIERIERRFKLEFNSISLTNDERMLASARTIEIEGDALHYEMTMHTTRVDKLTRHILADLRRKD